ncbi:phytoene/squalene synthase family protein [Alsobacter sp. R-9]
MARRSADRRAEADYEACRALIRQGSKTFFAASLLLPDEVRRSSYALYAFCRLSDDAVDAPDARRDAVERLQRRLDRIYEGRPGAHAADRAFADVVARTALPRALPEALLEGLAWDADGRRYETLADLRAYAARVAATVGAMMTVLMGVRHGPTLARACDLGVAMQLTNIARDVGEDARNGRIYLPLDWLQEEGLDADGFIAAPSPCARTARLVERLLAAADALYERATGGIAGLPPACRPAIHAARLIYREIGREVARNGFDSVTRRAVVPTSRKLTLVAAALAGAATAGGRGMAVDPLPETRFLVEAAAAGVSPAEADVTGAGPLQAVDQRIGWVIDLFGKIEERQHAMPGPADRGRVLAP